MGEHRWFDLLHENFDKLLLVGLILGFTCVHLFRPTQDAATMAWGREQITLTVGTLLGLLGGPAVKSLVGHKPAPPNGTPPANGTPPGATGANPTA